MPDSSLPGEYYSRHFLIQAGANDDDTLARTKAIAETCEKDLTTLQQWFSCNFDESPFGIIVFVAAGTHLGGASNFGYTTDVSSEIDINGTYAPPNGTPSPVLRDELARMVFVAELAEILMDFATPGWGRGNSMGEGLSILAAETLHPLGYYGTGSGPRIRAWLQGSRPDFVSNTEGTDSNAVSYGCAVLFLNFLRFQLGFSFDRIVSAGNNVFLLGGETLASVFSVLTGRPATMAYKEFTDLLQSHLPLGQPFSPVSDNLFPLRPQGQRSLTFSSSDTELSAIQDPETLFIKRQAGPMCPPNIYSYHNVNLSTLLKLSGKSFGFAQPTFTWAVNGVTLNNSSTPLNTVISMTATDTLPGTGEPAVPVNLPIKYLIQSSGFGTTLFLWNGSSPGNGALTISLSAVESLVTADAATNYTDQTTLLTRRYSMGGSWSRDVGSCNIEDLGLITQTVKSLAHRLVEDENRPNPNPTLVRALADATQTYVHALNRITGGSRGLERAVVDSLTDLEAVRAPREAPTFHDAQTGLRIRHRLPQAPPVELSRDREDEERGPAPMVDGGVVIPLKIRESM